MSINRWPEFTFVFIVCLVDFVWKYRFGGERFPIFRHGESSVKLIVGSFLVLP